MLPQSQKNKTSTPHIKPRPCVRPLSHHLVVLLLLPALKNGVVFLIILPTHTFPSRSLLPKPHLTSSPLHHQGSTSSNCYNRYTHTHKYNSLSQHRSRHGTTRACLPARLLKNGPLCKVLDNHTSCVKLVPFVLTGGYLDSFDGVCSICWRVEWVG